MCIDNKLKTFRDSFKIFFISILNKTVYIINFTILAHCNFLNKPKIKSINLNLYLYFTVIIISSIISFIYPHINQLINKVTNFSPDVREHQSTENKELLSNFFALWTLISYHCSTFEVTEVNVYIISLRHFYILSIAIPRNKGKSKLSLVTSIHFVSVSFL